MENNNKYTLDDIKNFIDEYKEKHKIKPQDWMVSVPLVGRKIYQRAALENMKISIFEQQYDKAINGNIEDKDDFIKQMEPVLDYFYSNNIKKNTHTKKR